LTLTPFIADPFIEKLTLTPLIPVGLILGPMAEVHLRRALSISQGDWLVFFKQPIACTFMVITIAVLFVPWILRRRGVRLSEDD
jgi:putative tricarboxylic transport membrane protein